DFADVKSVMQGAGSALMGIGSARGEDRAVKAAELAIASPLLEASIDGAHGVLLSIQGGSDLGLFEINEAARLVQEVAHPEANIIFGAVIDDALGDEARVTVIAAGFDQVDVTSAPAQQYQQPQTQQPLPQHTPVRGTMPLAPAQRAAPPAAAPAAVPAAPESAPAAHNGPRYQELPAIVEQDLSGGSHDDLDVPDFLK
ncbi:MAG: cell division protein FtsZ, partial [Arthrobacter sp.]